MKKVLIFCAFVAAVQASVIYTPDIVNTGASVQHRSQDSLGNYDFGYDERHLTGGTFRKESGDAYGNKVGSYGLRDADGRARVVNYVADDSGFHVNIDSNEPGVEAKDPADTSINKAKSVVVAATPTVTHAAPDTHAVSYATSPAFYSYASAPTFYGFKYASAPVVQGYKYTSDPIVQRYKYINVPNFYNYKYVGVPGYHGYRYISAPNYYGYRYADIPAIYGYKNVVSPTVYGYNFAGYPYLWGHRNVW
ncbi:uncharacterized protein LOC143237100 [Tachypleus tridentatus]|uniref:uncharacterized protein LOC143237100 n=1 Tax=Tachypleus tridentatus TaxID=6853 RepID=UPI003FCF7E7F